LTQNPVHLAPFPRISRISAPCDPAHALSTYRVGQRHTSWACTAPIGRARTDERHKLIGGTDQLGLMRWPLAATHHAPESAPCPGRSSPPRSSRVEPFPLDELAGQPESGPEHGER
jgi:hypothetical protein